ncbi:membrane protein insertion efficiency factor YidD [Arcicella lustrica]|uniref:Membrane protein insertion efficiency factor YidD n=1 Tax=Arcicella lustrica TaxID=2984196 RepID=A0ABU5SFB1_9BACT|nr:membrane protein insertion efficiency factor YidD [Arcicella sp. DC25W]MEA5425951.1 membrane protein insertion efficiency factor YidD [Arcicella sp. DC25W]
MRKSLNKVSVHVILLISCFFLAQGIRAQSLKTDLTYLIQKDSSSKLSAQTQKPKTFNPILLFLNGSLKVYQKVISPQFSANCLYELSCSRFSQSAIQEYGIVKGLALTADRLARCNRISGTTINPFRVNEQGKVIDSPKMYKIE